MTRDPWFVVRRPLPAAPVRLMCLPHAGGSSAVYQDWPAALGADVEVDAVALPGREHRWSEPPAVEPERVAQAVAARADRPYALFGHSLGALVAFEVVHHLLREGGPLPTRLFVAGCPSPDTPRDGDVFDGLSRLPDSELLTRLVDAGGVPEEAAAFPELLELMLPAYRADFGWLDAYTAPGRPPLPVPVTAFAGADDASARPADVERWDAHTSVGFELHVLPGGHFFLEDGLSRIADAIRKRLSTPVR